MSAGFQGGGEGVGSGLFKPFAGFVPPAAPPSRLVDPTRETGAVSMSPAGNLYGIRDNFGRAAAASAPLSGERCTAVGAPSIVVRFPPMDDPGGKRQEHS